MPLLQAPGFPPGVPNSFHRPARGALGSVVTLLLTRSPLLHALDRLPIDAVHHSIIGDRGRGDTPNSSDGVVPYSSSHLASAQSEKIVPTGHEPMADPQAIEEIRRLLLLNLGIRANRPSTASVHIILVTRRVGR